MYSDKRKRKNKKERKKEKKDKVVCEFSKCFGFYVIVNTNHILDSSSFTVLVSLLLSVVVTLSRATLFIIMNTVIDKGGRVYLFVIRDPSV